MFGKDDNQASEGFYSFDHNATDPNHSRTLQSSTANYQAHSRLLDVNCFKQFRISDPIGLLLTGASCLSASSSASSAPASYFIAEGFMADHGGPCKVQNFSFPKLLEPAASPKIWTAALGSSLSGHQKAVGMLHICLLASKLPPPSSSSPALFHNLFLSAGIFITSAVVWYQV